ncbi:Hypothetical predicted protein [Pelobates cultripes]|nr:Hypothetical predicted protein [Pelobates cultripes]
MAGWEKLLDGFSFSTMGYIVARREETLPKLDEEISKWKNCLAESTSPEIYNDILKEIQLKVDKLELDIIEIKKKKYLRDTIDYKTGNVRKRNNNNKNNIRQNTFVKRKQYSQDNYSQHPLTTRDPLERNDNTKWEKRRKIPHKDNPLESYDVNTKYDKSKRVPYENNTKKYTNGVQQNRWQPYNKKKIYDSKTAESPKAYKHIPIQRRQQCTNFESIVTTNNQDSRKYSDVVKERAQRKEQEKHSREEPPYHLQEKPIPQHREQRKVNDNTPSPQIPHHHLFFGGT